MIDVLYSSLVVSFCLMFPQTKYEYDLLLSLYFIYTCILHYYRMFSIPFQCTLYLLYTSRGVFIWRINYCHCHCQSYAMYIEVRVQWGGRGDKLRLKCAFIAEVIYLINLEKTFTIFHTKIKNLWTLPIHSS